MGKIPSGWRTTVSQHHARKVRAGKRYARLARKCGPCLVAKTEAQRDMLALYNALKGM